MKRRIYTIPLAVVGIIAIIARILAPREVNWSPSFTRNDKVPYGTYILYDLLPDLFHDASIASSTGPAYNALGSGHLEYTAGDDRDPRHTGEEMNYIIINTEFSPDELDRTALFDFVDAGSRVFVAAESFGSDFADSLHIDIAGNYNVFGGDSSKVAINFTSPSLKSAVPYSYRRMVADRYFKDFDTASTEILGINTLGEPNFIRVRYGRGAFYLSALPYAFTNYNVLDAKNGEYIYKALSYLPPATVIWDEYYKVGRRVITSPMRYVLSQEALAWAFYIGLIGVACFMLFMGKRRQRIIPEIRPLPNTTLQFAATVSQLYFQHADHRNIAEKRITYFLDYLRIRFGITSSDLRGDFHRLVASRSGVDEEEVRMVFDRIEQVRRASSLTDQQLMKINAAIEGFQKRGR
ncbi:MAG: hypothetical protein JWQ98_707 [Chlorobi bacterium]|nr:hypothetical protein [Chlorobiota bacterium]